MYVFIIEFHEKNNIGYICGFKIEITKNRVKSDLKLWFLTLSIIKIHL